MKLVVFFVFFLHCVISTQGQSTLNPLTCDPSSTREGCGYIGIAQSECQKLGCCWTPDPPNDKEPFIPWCYKSNRVPPEDSAADIAAYCAKAPGAQTLWERYVCSVVYSGQFPLQTSCTPQRRRSTCPKNSLRGMVVLFHGFGQCPDVFSEIAPRLQQECFNVYVPTLPGHGYNCSSTPTASCVDGAEISRVPTARKDYLDFVDQMAAIVTQERNITLTAQIGVDKYNSSTFLTAVGGHDFGAPVAVLTAIRNSNITKNLLITPRFGISSDEEDADTFFCVREGRPLFDCSRFWFRGLASNFPGVAQNADTLATLLSSFSLTLSPSGGYLGVEDTIQDTLTRVAESALGVNTQVVNLDVLGDTSSVQGLCKASRRSGFCSARIRHFLAVHSFGQYVMHSARTAPAKLQTQVIATAADGSLGNRLTFQAVRNLVTGGSSANACVFYPALGCPQGTGQECLVPHAAISILEAQAGGPTGMYWNTTLISDSISWLKGTISKAGSSVSDGTRMTCQIEDVVTPDMDIALMPRTYVNFKIQKLETAKRDAALTKFRTDLVSFLRLPPYLAETVRILDSSTAPVRIRFRSQQTSSSSSSSSFENIVVMLPDVGAATLRTLNAVEANYTISKPVLGNTAVVSVISSKIDGDASETLAASSKSSNSASTSSGGNKIPAWVFGLVVGLLILAIILVVIFFSLRIRYLSQGGAGSANRSYASPPAQQQGFSNVGSPRPPPQSGPYGAAQQQSNAYSNPPPPGPAGAAYRNPNSPRNPIPNSPPR